MGIFKACDIRGVYPGELDEATYAGLGRAVGTLLRERVASPQVLVAGDVRPSTPLLRAALTEGLVATGCSVADLGIVPTPVAYFASRQQQCDGLAIVTASHNPAGYNGLKLCLGPMPITEEEMGRVAAASASGRFACGRGSVRTLSVMDAYVVWLCAGARPGDGLKLVLDCGNGGCSELAPRVLRRLGYDVVELFCTPDGTFPNRSPNPAVPENLGALRQKVREANAALGVALDGDGDRLAIADDLGRSLTGDQAIILLARHVLAGRDEGRGTRDATEWPGAAGARDDGETEEAESSPLAKPSSSEIRHSSFVIDSSFVIRHSSFRSSPTPKVVLDIKCSQAVFEAVRASGGTPLLERSGHTFIKTRMITESAHFGGELSGHFFYRELAGGDDGLYSILRVVELARGAGRPISALVDAMPRYATTPDIRVPYEAGDGPTRIEQIAAAATGEVLRLDGVRVAYPDGWGLARCSVTEPLLTFRFEAFEGSPRRIAQRVLAAAPDLLTLVLERLDALQGPGGRP